MGRYGASRQLVRSERIATIGGEKLRASGVRLRVSRFEHEGDGSVVQVILQIYPVIPAADEAERAALRPLGRNVERNLELFMQEINSALDEFTAYEE